MESGISFVIELNCLRNLMQITIVVSLAQRVDIVFGELVEIVLLAGHDVHLVDDHVVLAIWSLTEIKSH